MFGFDGTTPYRFAGAGLLLSLVVALGCDDTNRSPTAVPEIGEVAAAATMDPGPYELSPAVFDIAAMPDGSILLAENTSLKEIRKGNVSEVIGIPTVPGSPVNGLEAVGRGSFFATSGGLDLAVGAGVWHVSRGRVELIGDIEAFETANDPDAFEGPQWKTPACEIPGGFSAGPQSNPYHLARLTGGTVLVADAAGNTVLSARTNGEVDWVAVLTPPTPAGSSSSDPSDWLVQFPLDADTDCYVQPVPTSVAVGPDGAYYVGELTGVTLEELTGGTTTGLSRVWRIASGSRNVVCPSAECEQVLSGFTSIIDVAFGPDGRLYVVEYDENGWWGATVVGAPAGGTISACDVDGGSCEIVAANLGLPSAITFDTWGDLWVLENNIGLPFVGTGAPTVRRLD